jgi:hypothetical protein
VSVRPPGQSTAAASTRTPRRRPRLLVLAVLLLVLLAARAPWLSRSSGGQLPPVGESQSPLPAPSDTAVLATGSAPGANASTSSAVPANRSDDGEAGPGEREHPSAPADPAEVQRVATRFTTAWLNPVGGRDAWLARLKPLTEPALQEGLALTDLTLLPSAAVHGVCRVLYVSDHDALVHVPTTAGALELVLVQVAPPTTENPTGTGTGPAPASAQASATGTPPTPGTTAQTTLETAGGRWVVRSIAPAGR